MIDGGVMIGIRENNFICCFLCGYGLELEVGLFKDKNDSIVDEEWFYENLDGGRMEIIVFRNCGLENSSEIFVLVRWGKYF